MYTFSFFLLHLVWHCNCRSGQLDVRELISLYPFLLPTSSSFIRSHPPLHEYADLNQLTQGDQEKMTKCKRFLMSYLNEVRSTEVANGYKEDIDTALLKLYAEANHESLLDLLVSENFCLLTDSAAWLEKHKKWVDFWVLHLWDQRENCLKRYWLLEQMCSDPWSFCAFRSKRQLGLTCQHFKMLVKKY